MIITCSSHGRTRQDCRRLVRHLENTKDNESIHLVEIGNSVSATLADVVEDMQLLRDGGSAQVSLHHFTINPSSDCDEAALRKIANLVRAELDPELIRPYAVVVHTKNRQAAPGGRQAAPGNGQAAPGGGKRHAHLILGHVDSGGRPGHMNSGGRALLDGQSKRRTEFVARVAEHFLSGLGYPERPVAGRHSVYTMSRMRDEAPAAAEWHAARSDMSAEKPMSAMSTTTRQRAKRLGLNLPGSKATIVAAWQASPDLVGFLEKVREAGFSIARGDKAGVWIVTDTQGRSVGALDRLLRLRRQEIREKMEAIDVKRFFEQCAFERGAGQNAFIADRSSSGNAGSAGYSGRGSDRTDIALSGSLGGSGHAPERSHASGERKAGRNPGYHRQIALSRLRRLGSGFVANPKFSKEYISQLHASSSEVWRGAHDIWGLPIEPNKKALYF
jgi:hypothetical protein